MRVIQRAAAQRLHGRLACCLVLLAVGTVAACDNVDHENIDKWRSTEKGPDKLRTALRSSDLDADLRAHAAHNLITIDRFSEVKEALEDMPESDQHTVMAKLAPYLWDTARIARELDVPSHTQAQAKDAMFDLRAYADDATRKQIEANLIQWLTGGHYEGRATIGRVSGRMMVRELGPLTAPKLVEAARRVLARPPTADGARVKVGDELLAALASTGDAEAASLLVDMVAKDYKDDTLARRAMAALHEAYVQPTAGQPVSPRPGLVAQVARLGEAARDENLPGVMNNDAVDLISVLGPPECISPLVELVSMPAAQQAFRWVGIQRGLRCGGAQAVVPIVEAIPDTVAYERALLDKYVWKEIIAAPAPVKLAEAARQLLSSRSWVAKVTGMEVLRALKLRDAAAEDAKRIRQLAGNGTVLKGWWGPQKDAPAGKKKPDPTLGKVAEEIAGELQVLAKGTETK